MDTSPQFNSFLSNIMEIQGERDERINMDDNGLEKR